MLNNAITLKIHLLIRHVVSQELEIKRHDMTYISSRDQIKSWNHHVHMYLEACESDVYRPLKGYHGRQCQSIDPHAAPDMHEPSIQSNLISHSQWCHSETPPPLWCLNHTIHHAFSQSVGKSRQSSTFYFLFYFEKNIYPRNKGLSAIMTLWSAPDQLLLT